MVKIVPLDMDTETEDPKTKDRWFYRYFRGIQLHLILGGVHWGRLITGRRITKPKLWLLRFYTSVCLLIHWYNMIRVMLLLSNNETFGTALFNKLIIMVNCVQLASYATTLTAKSNKLAKFVEVLGKIYDARLLGSHGNLKTKPEGYEKSLRRLCFVLHGYTLTIYIFGYVGVLFTFYIVSGVDNSVKLFAVAPLSLESPYSNTLLIIYCFIAPVSFFAIGTMAVSFSACSYVIYKEFMYVNKLCEQSINEIEESKIDIEDIRNQHDLVCQLVEIADDIFRFPIGMTCFLSLFLLCVVLYNLAYGTGAWNLGAMLSQFLSEAIMVASVLTQSCFINIAAHGATSHIYKLSLRRASFEMLHKVNIFLTRLTGPGIGLTASGLLVVDTNLVLSLCGALVTYAVIVFQFHQPSNSAGPAPLSTAIPFTNSSHPL